MTDDASERSTIDSRESRLFESLLRPGEQCVCRSEITRVLEQSGLRSDDPRLQSMFAEFARGESDASFDEQQFFNLTRGCLLPLEAAASRDLIIPEFARFSDRVRTFFQQAEENTSGAVADYIPQLSRVPPDQFGLAICTIDGQRLTEGDAHTPFCVQSVSKPFNYCFALEELGADTVHRHMGCEPSGVSFNELALDRNGVPHNPMINSGGIMSCALIKQGEPVSRRFDHISQMWSRLAGGARPGFSNATYLSERETADRNFALAYSMREHGAFPEGVDLIENLEFYFQCCSLEMTADTLAAAGATLANGGLCPLTGEQVISANAVQCCLSLMLSCGMYDYSGEWAFHVGLPAKSGVSGAVLTIVPNVMGICTWSPRLDALGNSVRGIDFCKRLVRQYNFHVYDGLGTGTTEKLDPRRRSAAEQRQMQVDLFWAASAGECDSISYLADRGVAIDIADYDGRTPLHLAASEGRGDAVQLLIQLGASPDRRDRWGNTPLDDATREKHTDVIEHLKHNRTMRASE